MDMEYRITAGGYKYDFNDGEGELFLLCISCGYYNIFITDCFLFDSIDEMERYIDSHELDGGEAYEAKRISVMR